MFPFVLFKQIQSKLTGMQRFFCLTFLLLLAIFSNAQALSGNYSIGNDASDDYTTVALAADALMNNGIDGPVVFGIRPGSYAVEELLISNINGSSETNTIRFEALNTSAPVVLQSTTYVMRIEKSNYFDFDGLTFEILEDNGQNVGLHIKGSSNINITNNRFTASFLGSNYPQDRESFIHLEGISEYDNGTSTYIHFPVNYVQIENNIFHGGNGAIYSRGGTERNEYLNITNNIFEEKSGNDMRIYYTNHVVIKNNVITGERLDESLDFRYIENDFEFSQNRQYVHAVVNSPLYILDCTMDSAAPMIFKNNFFSTDRNISILRSSNINIWNNSFNSSTNYYIIRLEQNLMNIAFNNNVLKGGSNSLLYFSSETDFTEFDIDYNSYYNTENADVFNVSTTSYDFENWKSTYSHDTNSILAQPNFTSTSDLHLNNDVLINGKGKVLLEVTVDIDGEIRNAATPDIGADEFNLDTNTLVDIEVVSLVYQNNDPCSLLDPIQILVANHSTLPVSSFDLEWWFNDAPMGNTTINELIDSNSTKVINVGNYSFTPNTTYHLKFVISSPNGEVDNNLSNNGLNQKYTHFNELKVYKEKDATCSDTYTLYVKKQPDAGITWSTGENTNFISASSSGTYSVTVVSANGCSITNSIIIE